MNFILTFFRVLGDEIVTLYVGKKRQKIPVHKKLICDRCEYFSKAIGGNFSEAEKGEMYLPEDQPEAVSSLVDYLYRGALPTGDPKEDSGYRKLPELYFLAEKLCMNALADKCCDLIRVRCRAKKRMPGPLPIRRVYLNTCDGSKLRIFCASIIACSMAKGTISSVKRLRSYLSLNDGCQNFFVDLFKWQLDHGKAVSEELSKNQNMSESELVELFGPCKFHSHGKDKKCYLKDTE